MARATGVQISDNRVRVAEIDGTPQKFKIRGSADVLLDRSDPDDQAGALQKAIKEAFKLSKASRENVILGISATECVLRQISVPFHDKAQIEKIIRFESEPHLHSCTLDDVVVCFHKLVEIGTKSMVLVMAAKKERLQEPLAALEKLGIDPLAVDLDAAGLLALSTTVKEVSEHENLILCEVGSESSTVILVQNRQLRALRTIRLGTSSITSRIGRDLELDATQADARARSILAESEGSTDDLFVPMESSNDAGETEKTAPELERDIVLQREQELVDRLARELRRTLASGDRDAETETVFVTGPGSIFPNFKEQLAETLGLPVQSLPMLAHADHKIVGSTEIATANATMPTAVGLALKHLGKDELGIDFRQEEFKFKRRFDRVKAPLLLLVAMLTVANACWLTFEQSMTKHHNERVISHIAAQARTLFASIVKKVDRKTMKTAQLDQKQLDIMHDDVEGRTGRESIDRVKRNIGRMHQNLRKLYNLDGAMKRRSSRSRRAPSAAAGGTQNVSDFSSALLRWEQVFAAISQTGIKEFSVNSLHATPVKVEFGITLPELAEINNQKISPQDQLNLVETSLQNLDKEMGFKTLTNPGKYTENSDHRGFDFPKILVEFNSERR